MDEVKSAAVTIAPKPKRLRNAARRAYDIIAAKEKAEADAIKAQQKAEADAALAAIEATKTGKQRRKRSPKNKTKRTNLGASERMKAMWEAPGYREHMKIKMAPVIAYRLAHPEEFSRRGVPDGMRKVQSDKLWAKARVKAKKVIKIMEAQGALPVVVIPDSDDEKAKVVLEEMMTIVLSPLTHQPTKIAAGRTVLEWTRSKPVLKTAVAISNAEEWLNSVIVDNKVSDGKPRRLEGSTLQISN